MGKQERHAETTTTTLQQQEIDFAHQSVDQTGCVGGGALHVVDFERVEQVWSLTVERHAVQQTERDEREQKEQLHELVEKALQPLELPVDEEELDDRRRQNADTERKHERVQMAKVAQLDAERERHELQTARNGSAIQRGAERADHGDVERTQRRRLRHDEKARKQQTDAVAVAAESNEQRRDEKQQQHNPTHNGVDARKRRQTTN